MSVREYLPTLNPYITIADVKIPVKPAEAASLTETADRWFLAEHPSTDACNRMAIAAR